MEGKKFCVNFCKIVLVTINIIVVVSFGSVCMACHAACGALDSMLLSLVLRDSIAGYRNLGCSK